MCLAVPMKIVERGEDLGVVELDGVRREVSLQLQPEARLGDFVLVHAGYAIGLVDAAEAEETLSLLREMAMLEGAAGEA
ncbi:MAG TPA: HypC/HybG/HupF family hydrogenase formation chaperone [Thermoanaerobaculaceae bacterium]|nr:HypC/HybG/HupF family hydrogenase formation chaperone [Thermoanaerobaculaceae bacterium]